VQAHTGDPAPVKLRKILVLPDIHIPNQDPAALDAAEQYMRQEGPWAEVIQLGDLFDFDQIGRWRKDEPAAQLAKLSDDYSLGNLLLDRWQAHAPKAKFTLLAGNHDARADLLAAKQPQLAGLVEVDVNLRLAERGIQYIRCYPLNEVHQVGRILFMHGLYCGVTHARKSVDMFGCSVVYGHTHDIQAHTKTSFGKGNSIMAQSLGCLCKLQPPYMGQRPSAWSQAVGTYWIQPNGNWSSAVSVITDGVLVSPSGQTYRGKKRR